MIYTSKQEEAIHWKVEIDFISDLEIISEMKLCELGVSRDINNPASVQLVNYSYRKISSEKKFYNPKNFFAHRDTNNHLNPSIIK